MDITAVLRWLDTEKYDVTVPDHVTVTLYADGKAVRTRKAYFRENWECVFRKLPVYDKATGKRINYRITGQPLKGFTLAVEQKDQKKFVITYRATKPLPPTGDRNDPLLFAGAMLMSLGLILALKRRRAGGSGSR